jgi:hypothetical protein
MERDVVRRKRFAGGHPPAFDGVAKNVDGGAQRDFGLGHEFLLAVWLRRFVAAAHVHEHGLVTPYRAGG